MELITTVILILLIFMVCAALFFVYIPYLMQMWRMNKGILSSQIINKFKSIKGKKQNFLTANKPGRTFIDLINRGFFLCLKTGNHGNDFPDKRQSENFRKYISPEISAAIYKLEANHEEFII